MDLEGQKPERTDLGDVAKAALNFKFVQSSVQDRFYSIYFIIFYLSF